MKMHPCGSRKESSFPVGDQRSCFLTTGSKVAAETLLQCPQKWWGPGSLCSCSIAQGLPKSFAWFCLFKMYFLDLLAFKKKQQQTKPTFFGKYSLIGDSLGQINSEFWSHCVCIESIGIISLCRKPLETECWNKPGISFLYICLIEDFMALQLNTWGWIPDLTLVWWCASWVSPSVISDFV